MNGADVHDDFVTASSDGHSRNVSIDSGFDVSGVTDIAQGDTSLAWPTLAGREMDSSQDSGVAADQTRSLRHKRLSRSIRDSASSNSSDSGIILCGSISQESMDLDEQRDFRDSSTACSWAEKINECEMETCTEGDSSWLKGEDYPDSPENILSTAVRKFYSSLVDVISNQVTVDILASDLYSQSLIESEVCHIARLQCVSDNKKTCQLLDVVLSKLRMSKSVKPFDNFVEVLSGYSACCHLVESIKAEYQQLKQTSEVSTSGGCEVNTQDEELVCGTGGCNSLETRAVVRGVQPPSSYLGATNSSPEQPWRSISSLLRPRSISSGGESDESMTEEEIKHDLKRLNKGIKKYINKQQENAGTMKQVVDRLELEVEDLLSQLKDNIKKLERCEEEKEALNGQLIMARRQILQLNKEVIGLKRPKPHSCSDPCTHKRKCEALVKQIQRLEGEKLDREATIANLTQQIDLLLNGV